MLQILTSSGMEEALESGRKWLAERVISQAVVVGPSFGVAEDFVLRCSRKKTGFLGFHRLSFLQLAGELATAELALNRRVPITGLGMTALCARSTYRCLKEPGLQYFGPVADFPGFSRALGATLPELRSERIDPRKLVEAGSAGGDFHHLLRLYEEEMEQTGLADTADVFRVAKRAVQRASHHYLQAPFVLLFVSPTRLVEREFLAALAEQVPDLLALVIAGDQGGVEALAESLNVEPKAIDDHRYRSDHKLDRLRRFLFLPSTPTEAPPKADDSLEFFSEPGEDRECVEIARRIRFAVKEGICFDQVAILLRSPRTYMPLVEDALRRAGIPGYFTHGTNRPDPAGRAFLALLQCASEGLSASRFAEYLSLGQTPLPDPAGKPPTAGSIPWAEPRNEQLSFKTPLAAPEDPVQAERWNNPEKEPVVAGTLQAPRQWEKLLVDAAVIGGRDRWEQRLQGLARELELQLKTLDREDQSNLAPLHRRIGQLAHLHRFALPLIKRLDELPQQARWQEWLTALERLAGVALKSPNSVLALISELRPMDEVGPVGLEEVQSVLHDRLSFLRQPPPGHRYGRVFVGTVEEVAGRSFELVFLPGLAEGIFPRKACEDPLLLDELRTRLSLERALDRKRLQERRLLHWAVASVRRRLVISYPRVDLAQGRARVPSFYALDLLRAAEGELPDVSRLEKRAAAASRTRLGWPAPKDRKLAVDDAEYDLALLDPLLSRGDESGEGHARFLIKTNKHLERSLRTRWYRWRPGFKPADGLVDPDPKTLDLLQSWRLSNRSYSPTSLQQFAACPYKFFLYSVHRLRPREEAAAVEQMDPLTRGALFHEVQFDLFSELRSRRLLPPSPDNLGRVQQVAETVFQRVVKKYEEDLAPAIPRVWATEVENLRTDLRGWLREVIRGGPGWIPDRFEFAFGLPLSPERDSESRPEDAVINRGVRVRGSIDLVEKSKTGAALRVTDHKTGKAPSKKALVVRGGEVLQPMIYALAAENLLKKPVQSGRLFYCTRRGEFQVIEVTLDEENRSKFQLVTDVIDKALAEGFLPAAPREKACGFCDYQRVCGPYEEQRVGRKDPTRLADLNRLRALP